jgi:hypothetical protein
MANQQTHAGRDWVLDEHGQWNRVPDNWRDACRYRAVASDFRMGVSAR